MKFVIEKKMNLDIKAKFANALFKAKNKPPPEPPREIKIGEKMKNNINERLAKTEKKDKNKPSYQYLAKNEKLEEVAPTKHDQQEIQPFRISELDLFNVESKTKVLVTDMIYPIIQQIQDERDERARVEVKYDQACERIERLERLNQATKTSKTPEYIEKIRDQIADLKMKMSSNSQKLQGALDFINELNTQ